MRKGDEEYDIYADFVVLATGGIGGKYKNSTNYRHLTGDAIDLAKKYSIETEHLDYVQIHPTTFYSDDNERRFLISESVRGEGALLYDKMVIVSLMNYYLEMLFLRQLRNRWKKMVLIMS